MTAERITSRSNPLMRHIKKLNASAAYRRESGRFVCDGDKLLREALAWHAPVETVVYAEDAAPPVLPDGVHLVQAPRELLRFISPSETPQNVLFLCAMEARPLPARLPGRRYLVLDGVQDPGNVGTMLRTADAFEADGMFLVNACADLYNPKTVRATMGALFRRPVWRCTPPELAALLDASEIVLYGAALDEHTVDARTADYGRCAIAIGSEGQGMSKEMLSLCDRTVRLPMSARCESLNAAVAAAVLLWEAYR